MKAVKIINYSVRSMKVILLSADSWMPRLITGKTIINRMIIALVALAIVGAAASSARATNIVWVTDTRDGVVQADWRTILTNAGYTVTGFIGATNPTDPDELAVLNGADLVIYDCSHGSTEGAGSTWNAISAPLLNQSMYNLDNWGWTGGEALNNNDKRPTVYVTSDPMWTGVTVPLQEDLFTGVRAARAVFNAGGVRIAGNDDASPASLHIGRWAAGALNASGGARMFFAGLTGGDNAMNLTALGQTVWLNAIDSLINPPTEPLLMLTEPVDNQEDVVVSDDLSATFNIPVQAGTGSIVLYKSGPTVVESFNVETSVQLTFNYNTVTIDPTNNLEVGTEYYVLIEATAIESTADESPFVGITDPTVWSFTTDGTPPGGAPLWPADEDANVQPNTDLVITFDENVVAGSGNITVHLASNGSVVDTIAVSMAAISGSEVTFTLNGALAYGTAYYVNASSGAIRDTSGNDWAGISDSTTWNFSTRSENLALLAYYVDGSDADTAALVNLTTPSEYTASDLSSVGFTAQTTTTVTPDGTEWLNVGARDLGSSPVVSTDEYYQFSLAGIGDKTIDPLSLTFNWSAYNTGDGGDIVGSYQVFASSDGSTFSAVGTVGSITLVNTGAYPIILASEAQTIDLNGLSPASSYTFRIALGDNSGASKKGLLFQAIQLNGKIATPPAAGTIISIR